MQSNKLFDKISEDYKKYIAYTEALVEKRKKIQDDKKSIAENILKGDAEYTEDLAYVLFVENSLHSNDLHLSLIKLYTLVRGYMEMDGVMVLPAEITELCESFEPTYPKTMFVLKEDSTFDEREKGSVEKVKKNLKDTGELTRLSEELIKNMTESSNTN